ncbi:TonB-dependent receptor [Chitinimonas sp. PSY-7]|uniref:TonB-dependent receptor domain-containing protein n=1 Tax=Chitinimonas sp. PSY-7 TaxID=3459088 RepID=UPI00403FCE94
MKLNKISQAILLMGAVGMAHHAVADETVQKADKIEITGSSIKRIVKEGALPVQQFKREDIDRSGAVTVADFVQKLPAMQGFTIGAIAAGSDSGGRVSASIHDIGEEYTLVLLNGRRVAPAPGLGSAVNLNGIPMSAVERVEVLTDGASALYGSDAIAGVLNFILKKNLQGGQIETLYQAPQESGGNSWNVSATYGIGDISSDGYNVLMSYRHDEQKAMKATDRDFSKTAFIHFNNGGRDYIYDRTSASSIPANATVTFTDASNLDPITFNPYKLANGNCPRLTFESITNPNACNFDFAATVETVPENKRDSFFTSGRLKVGDNVTLFSDIALSRFDLTARIAPNVVPFSIPFTAQNTPNLYTTYIENNLTPAQRAAVKSISGNYRSYDWGTRDSRTITDSTHLVFGAEADLGAWNTSGAVTWSRNSLDEQYTGGYMLAKEFTDMLNTNAFDPFAPIGSQSANTQQLIRNSLFNGSIRKASSTLKGIDARGSREIFELAGGMASVGLGADYREYDFTQTPSAAAVNNLLYAVDAKARYDMKRSNIGVFGELNMPVNNKLEVTTAARYDTISAIDDGVSNQTVGKRMSASTFKLSARYQPTKALLIRGSLGTGFKAPSMLEIAEPITHHGVTASSYDCPAILRAENRNYCKPGSAQYDEYRRGNTELKPEKSEQFTIGFRVEPSQAISFGADLWDVQIKDAVSSVTEQLAFANVEKYRNLFSTYTEQETGNTYWAFNEVTTNIGKSRRRGIDWDATGRAKLPFGTLTTNFTGTYLLKSEYTKPGTGSDWTTSLGYFGIDNAVSFRVISKLNATLQTGALSNSLTVNYRSGYTDAPSTVRDVAANKVVRNFRLEVPSYTTVDWQGRYAVNKVAEVRGGIKNLFNRKPPLSLRNSSGHQVGYDPRYTDDLLRTFYISGTYKF